MKQGHRLKVISVLYGMAALLVVFGHSHPIHTAYTEWPIKFVYRFHMPLFFFIAGVLVAYTSHERKILIWWKKKISRFLVPYVVLTAAAWVPKVILSRYMNDDMTISLRNLVRMLLIPREGVWGHFWFIPVYLLLMLIAAVVWKYVENASKVIRGGYSLPLSC